MNNNTLRIDKIKELFFMFLLFIWTTFPIFKNIRITNKFITKYNIEYTFIILVGLLGVFFLFLNIYDNLSRAKNKKDYYKKISPIILLFIYMVWTLISCLFSDNFNTSFFGTSYRKEGYVTYLAYAGFFAYAFSINSKRKKFFLINTFIVMSILNIVMIELYKAGILRNLLYPRSTQLACFFNRNHYGYYLLLSTASSVFLFLTSNNKLSKILYFISSTFLLYFLMLNNTLGCILAFSVAFILFIIYCFGHKKIKINFNVILFIIILAVLLFTNEKIINLVKPNVNAFIEDINNIILGFKNSDIELIGQAGNSRIKLWIIGLKLFTDNPILGYGPDNLGKQYLVFGITQDRPHNLLIQLATTSGIIGLLTYVFAIRIILIRGLKNAKFDNPIHIVVLFVIIAYLISAMFGNSMYYTSPYFFIFLGFLMNENINNNTDK